MAKPWTVEMVEMMSASARHQLRVNAELLLQRDPKNAEALKLITIIDELESKLSKPRPTPKAGELAWDKFGSGRTFIHGRVNDQTVATIWKRENHTYVNEDIYRVSLGDRPVPGPFRFLKDAKAAVAGHLHQQEA